MCTKTAGAQTTPGAAALAASEAIRRLNLLTFGRDGYTWPADVDDVVASLQLVAGRMTQAFAQANSWLNDAATAGTVGDDRGIDPRSALASAQELFARAITQASALSSTLDHVHQHTAHLTGVRRQVEGGDE